MTDPEDSFPQFESWPAAEYLSGLAGPFDPHTGQSFMWSDRADEAYKRLTRTINVPAGGASLSFWTSFNLELDFDYLIVEAHTVGQDNWTTLADNNGHTTNDLSTDLSCTGGWSNPADAANVLHPFLTHYQTFQSDGTCTNTGSSGEWNAANGSSSGWQQLAFDIPAGLGPQVEISITSVSDWGFQQFPGVFIDDIVVSTGEGSTSFEEDGDPMDGWTVPGAPQDAEGIEGRQPQRLDPSRRSRNQGGSRRGDPRHGLHGPWLRRHHRCPEAERADGARHHLPPSIARTGRGGTRESRPVLLWKLLSPRLYADRGSTRTRRVLTTSAAQDSKR